MKIYTKTGDRGTTSLFSGERVSKADWRIEVYGCVDELNAVLGVLNSSLSEDRKEISSEIWHIQSDLLRISTWLAASPDTASLYHFPLSTEETSAWLERSIDRMEQTLPPLTHFVHPGGHPAAAWAHVARAVCRRAERRVAALAESAAHPEVRDTLPAAMTYLNRLSDYLFVLARYLNHLHGVAERPWRP